MKKLAGVYVKSIFILPFELSRYHLFCIAETLVWMLIFTDCEICFSGSTVKEGDQLEQGSSILKMVFAHPSPCCKLLIALGSDPGDGRPQWVGLGLGHQGGGSQGGWNPALQPARLALREHVHVRLSRLVTAIYVSLCSFSKGNSGKSFRVSWMTTSGSLVL